MVYSQYPIITLEEAWLSTHVREWYASHSAHDPNAEDGITGYATSSLMEFGEKRLGSMNDNGISLQVVSHVPITLPLDAETSTKVNDELHSFVKGSPNGRFAAFACLPMAYPDAAAVELKRCVCELGFLGTLLDSNCAGRFYDDPFFWPVFHTAQELDVPVYIHPAPNEEVKKTLYAGNYPDTVAESLSEYGWGWHNETAVHFLRLFAAGVFDRFPKLKIVLGHCGEMLPFQLDRVANVAQRQWPHLGVKLEKNLRQVWDENVWITTSGMFAIPPMACLLRQCKPDRVMFSVDYPFGSNEVGVKFLASLKEEGLVDQEGLERLAYKNAETLLKVKVAADQM